MVNPGAFQGSRRDFLVEERASYSAGVTGGYAADALALIQRRYFKRYPVDLPHSVEPSEEFLAAVDDEAADVDVPEPNQDQMSEEEYRAAMQRLAERQRLFSYRKAQIKRWLAYQHMKDQDLDPKDSGALDPYRLLLHKLTGVSSQRPRLKSAVNVWRKTARAEIDATVKEKGNVPRAQMAKLRDQTAREMFAKFSEEERAQWAEQAKEDHEEAMKGWKRETEGDPSTTPEDRQRCIQGLVRFAQPILDLISEATGWKTTLIAGGPEPAHGGRLNVISVHSGSTSGDVKMNFGRAERARYKKFIVPIYGTFLQKCYSPEECRARALPIEEGFESLATMDLESAGADFDSVLQTSKNLTSDPSASSNATTPPIETPALQSQQPTSAVVPGGLSLPQILASPSPSPPPCRAGTPAQSAAARSDANAPPISPVCSRPNTPPLSPTLSGPNMSPTRPLPTSPPTVPTGAGVPRPVTPPVQPSMLEPAGEDSLMDSEMAIRTGNSGRAAGGRKRRIEDVEEGSDAPSKRTRASTSASLAGVPTMRTRNKAPTTAPPTKPARHEPRNKAPTTAAVRPPRNVIERSTRTLADSSVAITPVQAETNSPPWFSRTLIMLQSESRMGEEWMDLVTLWASFEARSGYEEAKKLAATGRPFAVGVWIGRARSSTWRPVIKKLPQYEESFWEWWSAIQPDWRLENGRLVRERVLGDWEALRRPGINGVVSIPVALFYWGLEVLKDSRSRKRWLSAVEECRAAFRQL